MDLAYVAERTGLGPLEVALLEATAVLQGGREIPVRTSEVLHDARELGHRRR